MKVEKLALLKEEIPEDCDILVIPGPTKKFLEREKELLGKYLEEGGKCLLALDPLSSAGLENLLKKWNLEVENDIVIDPASRIPFAGPTTLLVTNYPYLINY